MAVPNTFATATSAIPLANLDANFAYYDGAFSISGTATTFAGSVTLTSGTINQVQYLNGSKVLTGSANLTFDGTILTSTGFAGPLNGTIGATTANTGAFTTLTTSSTVTHNGGTANGVAYLNNSKVLTTGSAFVFDGTSVGIGTSSPVVKLHVSTSGNTPIIGETTGGATSYFNLRNTGGQAYIAASTNDLLFALTSSATEGMRLTSTGLGIGTTSPAYKLTINDATGNYYPIALTSSNMGVAGNYVGMLFGFAGTTYQKAAVIFQSADGNARGTLNFCLNGAATSANATLSDSKVAIDYSGNVGIGTSSPAFPLDVGGATANIRVAPSTATNNALTRYVNTGGTGYVGLDNSTGALTAAYALNFYHTGAYPIVFSTSGTERMRIDSSGYLLINTTTTVGGAARIGVLFAGNATNGINIQDSTTTSGAVFQQFSNSAGTQIGYIGRVTTTNAVVYSTTSDYRLKEVIGPVSGAGARIDALKPIDYQWKDGNQHARGFLAHEFQEVYADSVTGTKDAVDADGNPKYQAMQAATSEVIADLVAEIQSLRKRLTALESKEIS